jgi:hypothetical protein
MGSVAVVSRGNTMIYFDAADIRQVCSIMRCSEHLEECIELMTKGSMECPLCFAMMRVFKKPYSMTGKGQSLVRTRLKRQKVLAHANQTVYFDGGLENGKRGSQQVSSKI